MAGLVRQTSLPVLKNWFETDRKEIKLQKIEPAYRKTIQNSQLMNKNERQHYLSPETVVLELKMEGVIALSGLTNYNDGGVL